MNTALLIVDVQKGFTNEQCKKIPKTVAKLQNNYKYVAISRFYNEQGSPFRSQLGWHKVEKNSKDYQLAFEPVTNAFIFDKPAYSAYTSELETWLKKNHIEKIEVCGINTEVCVLHTVTELFLNKWNVYVIETACGSMRGKDYHKGGLMAIRHSIGDYSII